MRTYKVSGMTCSGCENAVTQAIRNELGEETAVKADAERGEVKVEEKADPQIVVFAIDGAGYTVDEVLYDSAP